MARLKLGRDATLIIAGQGLRAGAYGFTSVLLGALLASHDYSHFRAAVILTSIIAGNGFASIVVGAVSDRFGRRKSYVVFFVLLALSGAVVALGGPWWVLVIVAVTGTLSTSIVDNGPASTLEQVMLAREDAGSSAVYSRYYVVAATAGALGALAVVVPGVGQLGPNSTVNARLFGVLIPVGIVGALIATRLSPDIEAPARASAISGRAITAGLRLTESRGVVYRLASLFAIDAGASGLVTTGFMSYFFAQRYHVSLAALGWLFFAVTLVQAGSVTLAPRLARRFGLVTTMIATHIPSNVVFASVAFAPTFPIAVALFLAQATLSKMDIPTRQALTMSMVPPSEQSAAVAVTNAARYSVRPLGPLVAGAVQGIALGAPLVIAGGVSITYDFIMWRWVRHVPLRVEPDRGPQDIPSH